MPFELEMVPGQGTLQLRDADPYSLAAPTRIAGTADDQTGALSGLTFSTPNVEIEQEITSPLHADVLIEAVFSQVAPGSGTVDPSGNITITQAMKVELHIDVIPVGNTVPMDLPGDCVAAPIDLVLASTAPYDPETERVSITAGDFTIPEILASDACNDQLTPEVNKQLQGGGHSLSLVLEGEIPMPPDGDCDTTTSLVVAPSGSSPLGEEVTFTSSTAPVASDPECGDAAAGGEALSGVVDFMRDGVVIGSDEIAGDGTGTFSTSTLPAGNQNLTARFRGNNPYIRSTSGPISYLVTVAPQVTTTLPEFITLGQAVEFTTTVSNTSFGAALDDVRLDVDVRSFTAEPRIELFDGTTWVEIPLETLLPDYVGSLPTFDLAPGAERTERMRISVGTPSQPPAAPGNATLTFEVRPGDAALDTASPHDDALGSGEARTVFISTERVAPYFSYFWGPTGAVEPHTVRQGGHHRHLWVLHRAADPRIHRPGICGVPGRRPGRAGRS